MTTSQLHRIVLKHLCQTQPDEDLRRQKTCAWLIVGLVLEKTISLSTLALAIAGNALAERRERRIVRFLRNPLVKVRDYYDSVVRRAIAPLAGERLRLALDTTTLCGRITICRLALVYRGRAVPLV